MSDELNDPYLYRMAYGYACDAKERLGRESFTDGWPDSATLLRRLTEAVRREMGDFAGPALEDIRLAIEDAASGRRPRW